VADKLGGVTTPHEGRVGRPPPILVVDDDAFIRRVVRDALESEGFVVATSAAAAEALRVASQIHPAVVILDVHLPDMRGEIVAKKLNERIDEEIQIVTMTGDESVADSARDMRAVAYLRKPFDIDDLVRIVQDLLPIEPPSTCQATSPGRSTSVRP
jgi:DNA-binding response OmpR family regulator